MQGGDEVVIETPLGLKLINKYQIGDFTYIELENSQGMGWDTSHYQESIIEITKEKTFDSFFKVVLREVKKITNYAHLMVYQFDDEHNGEIIHELKNPGRPSYLGLKFPATDIPKQARALYFEEGIRTIGDVEKEQVAIYKNPKSKVKDELGLTNIHSRGVSPIHLEYLSNIGVKASFSVAIIKDDVLWGLLVCHHDKANVLNPRTRNWLKFLGKLISLNLDKIIREEVTQEEVEKQIKKSKILSQVIESSDLVNGFINNADDLMRFVGAKGLIVKSGDHYKTYGVEIEKHRLHSIFKYLKKKEDFDVISTSHSSGDFPKDFFHEEIAGWLIVQLSQITQDYLIFTRPEEIQEVFWAGDPTKAKTFDKEKGRMSPRKSFEKWKGELKGHARPWIDRDLKFALQIKNEIKEFLYSKVEELQALNTKLKDAYMQLESFSYTVSHDLKAPLRSIDGFAQILVEDYADKLDDYGISLLSMITKSVNKMNLFISEILNLSKVSMDNLQLKIIKVNQLINEVWESFGNQREGVDFDYNNEELEVFADERLISQVFSNLLSNSLKYSIDVNPRRIAITAQRKDDFIEFTIEDNGIGIPEGKEEEIFGIFRRMVSDKKYEGTGIGLAIVKKAIDYHNGNIRVDQNVEKGARFVFTLPVPKK